MEVLIVDSNEMRSKALKVVIEQTFKDCIAYKQVNGKDEISDDEINKGWDSIKDESELLMNDCPILFIHHNDNRQQYWRQFVELFLSKNNKNLCVSYSGGDTAKQINERHCPIDKPINDNAEGLWHVNDFLLSIKNNENNPFGILTGYDQLLEAKLELLHRCLLPSDAPILKEFQSDFNILNSFEAEYKSFLYEKMFLKKEVKAKYEAKEDYIFQESFQDNAFEATDEDVFHRDYIEALKQLRIALLGS